MNLAGDQLAEHYRFDSESRCWLPLSGAAGFGYSDGDAVEERLLEIVHSASDLRAVSSELRKHVSDWPSRYHLSPARANLLRPLADYLRGRTLEIGAGCGAITRFIAECGGDVHAIEGGRRRAQIAAARCRELENVCLFVDTFDRFPIRANYDAVTLIGVLEYARKYFPATQEDAIDAMLRRARRFLRPGGVLIVAIENQLGLKYFAGFGEDHYGLPMYGVEDHYDAGGVVTFGRSELSSRLAAAGLAAQRWWFPFPDYKIPTFLATERALVGHDRGELLPVLCGALASDPQRPLHVRFRLERAWNAVLRNRLGPELANSFLVIASEEEGNLDNSATFGYHFSVDRRREFAKQVVFARAPDGGIEVRQELLYPETPPTAGAPFRMQLDALPFLRGDHWQRRISHITTTPGWGMGDVEAWAVVWFEALLRQAGLPAQKGAISAQTPLPGRLLDAIPRNLIVAADGTAQFFDQEWRLDEPVEIGYLLFRGILHTVLALQNVAPPLPGTPMRAVDMFLKVAAALGIDIQQADLARYATLEREFQLWSSDIALDPIEYIHTRTLTVLDTLRFESQADSAVQPSQATDRERLARISALEGLLLDRDKRIDVLEARHGELTQERSEVLERLAVTAARDGERIAELKGRLADVEREAARLAEEAAESRARADANARSLAGLEGTLSQSEKRIAELAAQAARVDTLQHTIRERDASLRMLGDALQASDKTIAQLAQLRLAQEEQLRDLLQSTSVLSQRLAGLESSNSWRLTAPMRLVRRVLLTQPLHRLRKWISDNGRAAWHRLPVAVETKQAFKGAVFRNLPTTFGWTLAYRTWRDFTAPNEAPPAAFQAVPTGEVAGLPAETLTVPSTPGPDYVPKLADLGARRISFRPPARIVCFYLPQFHPIAENSAWWGEGFTEWTNVRPARPQFKGHYQPRIPADLGYYDLLDGNTMRRQVELANLYGVGGFCFYFYWFGGKRLLEAPLLRYLEDPALDLPFCLCWANENWTRRWDGLESEILIRQVSSSEDDLAFIAYIAKYLRDPRYIRVEGKPLVIVYRPGLIPDCAATARRWREWCRANGIGEICLALTQSFGFDPPARFGFDIAIEFPPNNAGLPSIAGEIEPSVPDFSSNVYDWRVLVERSRRYGDPAYPLFRGVCPSWDNTARRRRGASVLWHSSPRGYQEWLFNAIQDTGHRIASPEDRLVFVNAWNEWAEGAYLEPDLRYGYAHLEATRMALLRAALSGGSAQRRESERGLALVIHVFHEDIFEEILGHLARLRRMRCWVYATCPPERADSVEARLRASGFGFTLVPVVNRGRDIWPFLQILPQVIEAGHDILLKVHTKKSPHREDGHLWRADLFRKLIDDASVNGALKHFDSNSSSGIIGPAGHVVPMNYYWGSNAARVERLAGRLGIDNGALADLRFVAGSMFFARVQALLPLLNLGIDASEFEPESGQVDGTLAHALERVFSVSAHAIGLDVCVLSDDAEVTVDYPYAERAPKPTQN